MSLIRHRPWFWPSAELRNRGFLRHCGSRSWQGHPLYATAGAKKRAERAGRGAHTRGSSKRLALAFTVRYFWRKFHQKPASRLFQMRMSEGGEDGGYGKDLSSPGKIRKVLKGQIMEQPTQSSAKSDEVVVEDVLYLEGVGCVTAVLFRDCLSWHLTESNEEAAESCCFGCRDARYSPGQVPVGEIYASEMCEASRPASPGMCGGFFYSHLPQMHRFAVHSFERSHSQKCDWIPKAYTFCHEDATVCQTWVAHIQGLLDREVHRPKNLLVLVNPFGGKGSGVQSWESVAGLFKCARVKTKVIHTDRGGHAFDIVATASEEELMEQDGIVIVGGDGLFNEVLNGLLLSRHRGHAAPKPERVAKILAKASKAEKKQHENGTASRESRRPQVAVGVKPDSPAASSFDVHSPLLASAPSHAVDAARPLSSGSGSSSSSSPENAQQEVVNTTGTRDKEVELSVVDRASEPEGIETEEGKFLFPTEAAGVSANPADMNDPSSLAALVRHKSWRKTNIELRIGIIPAGSTDTIAVSTTGSRDPVTAALHIVLGDRMPLDVIRVTGWKKSPHSGDEPPVVRYAASFAGYGFYGDVMRESELNRWMGPARYDMAGAKVFMKHKNYEAEVSFLELPTTVTSARAEAESPKKKIICRANCFVCAKATDLNHLVHSDSEGEEDAAHGDLASSKPRWRTTRDSFQSVGAAVMSCRNDRAPDGIATHAHLADGLLHLILIRKCSRGNYLRQLLTLARKGADPFDFNFVEHYKTPVFTFTSHGEESVWIVDGELFPAHQLSGQCFRGLVNLFARGPEL